MFKELTASAPFTMKFSVVAPQESVYSVWIGGSTCPPSACFNGFAYFCCASVSHRVAGEIVFHPLFPDTVIICTPSRPSKSVCHQKMVHADAVRCKGTEDEFRIETTTEWILGTDGESSTVALGRQGGAQHKHSVRPQMSRTRREWRQNCERERLHVGMPRTRSARCDSQEITCFTNQQMTSWNRWNDRLSQSLWSLKSPPSLCPLVRKRCSAWSSPRQGSWLKRNARGDLRRDQRCI